MKLVPFNKSDPEAMKDLLALYTSWGHPECCPKEAELPSYGWTVPGVAACFLYQTDSNSCFFEHAITQRYHRDRTAAISEIVQRLLETARGLGYKKVYVSVSNEAATQRAQALGFKASGEPYRVQLEQEL